MFGNEERNPREHCQCQYALTTTQIQSSVPERTKEDAEECSEMKDSQSKSNFNFSSWSRHYWKIKVTVSVIIIPVCFANDERNVESFGYDSRAKTYKVVTIVQFMRGLEEQRCILWVLIHGGSAIAIFNLLLFGVLLLLSTARDFFIGFQLIYKITVPSLHLI